MFVLAFGQIYTQASSKSSSQFKNLVQKEEQLKSTAGTGDSSVAGGTAHSFSNQEYHAFADWINFILGKDDYLAKNNLLPIDCNPEKRQLFERCADGILLW